MLAQKQVHKVWLSFQCPVSKNETCAFVDDVCQSCSPVRRMAGNATAENPKEAKAKAKAKADSKGEATGEGPKKAKRSSGGKKSKFKR